MKNAQNSEELYEQYADAAAALVMDCYLAALQEYLAAQEPAPVEIGAELDAKCRRHIKKGLAGRLRRRIGKILLRALGIGAGVLLLLMGLFAILFSTVESVRVPVVNYFLDKQETYREVSGGAQSPALTGASGDVLAGLVPPGYEWSVLDLADPENIAIIYTNAQDEQIGYFTTPGYGTLHVDTEDAVVENITLCGLDAILIEKHGFHLLWFGEDNDLIYELVGTALTREEILTMAEAIECSRTNAPTANSDDSILAGLIPPGYALQILDDYAGCVTILYTTPQDDNIAYFESPADGTILRVDTEDAVTENIKVSGLDAILVEKNGYQLVWFSADGQRIYHLDVSSLSQEEVVAMAEAIESRR